MQRDYDDIESSINISGKRIRKKTNHYSHCGFTDENDAERDVEKDDESDYNDVFEIDDESDAEYSHCGFTDENDAEHDAERDVEIDDESDYNDVFEFDDESDAEINAAAAAVDAAAAPPKRKPKKMPSRKVLRTITNDEMKKPVAREKPVTKIDKSDNALHLLLPSNVRPTLEKTGNLAPHDNVVTKRKRQVKIKFIQTYHFVQFEIQHLNQM